VVRLSPVKIANSLGIGLKVEGTCLQAFSLAEPVSKASADIPPDFDRRKVFAKVWLSAERRTIGSHTMKTRSESPKEGNRIPEMGAAGAVRDKAPGRSRAVSEIREGRGSYVFRLGLRFALAD